MNFILLSISYEYLYSPTSWLHRQSSKRKIYFVFLQLALLPYASLKYMCALLIFFAYLCRSVYIPKSLRSYFRKVIGLFVFFLCINARHSTDFGSKTTSSQKIVRIYLLGNQDLSGINSALVNQTSAYSLWLQLSVMRLLSIYLIHIFLIKFLLLTTCYDRIVKIILSSIRYLIKPSKGKLIFEILICSQILKTIFKQAQIIKTAHLIRNLEIRDCSLKKHILAHLFSVRQLLANTYYITDHISNSLHSREINDSSSMRTTKTTRKMTQ